MPARTSRRCPDSASESVGSFQREEPCHSREAGDPTDSQVTTHIRAAASKTLSDS